MAKSTVKNTVAPEKKTTTTKTKAKASSTDTLDKISEETLKKLQTLGIEQQLQADLEWCLGSYRHDKNPSGLLGMMSRALETLKSEQAKKTKGVTSKLLTDLEKVLKG